MMHIVQRTHNDSILGKTWMHHNAKIWHGITCYRPVYWSLILSHYLSRLLWLTFQSFASRLLAVSIKSDSGGVEQSGRNLVPGMLNEHAACARKCFELSVLFQRISFTRKRCLGWQSYLKHLKSSSVLEQ